MGWVTETCRECGGSGRVQSQCCDGECSRECGTCEGTGRENRRD